MNYLAMAWIAAKVFLVISILPFLYSLGYLLYNKFYYKFTVTQSFVVADHKIAYLLLRRTLYSVSATAGALYKQSRFWSFMKWVINNTFKYIDMEDHCEWHYLRERKTHYNHSEGGVPPVHNSSGIRRWFLFLVIILTCTPFWFFFGLKRKFKPFPTRLGKLNKKDPAQIATRG